MKNTFEIINYHETCGDKFFTIAITNKEGETHTDLFSEVTLMKFAMKIVRNNPEAIVVDEENEELVNELEQLGFIEIAEEESEGKAIYDIYFHGFKIENGFVNYDGAGEYLKSFKTEKAAANFAAKKVYPVL